MRDTILWVKLLMLCLEIGLLFSFLGYLLKKSVCMFHNSCPRWLLMTVWSSMWTTMAFNVVVCSLKTIFYKCWLLCKHNWSGRRYRSFINRVWFQGDYDILWCYVSWRIQSWRNNGWWWCNVGSGSHVRYVSDFRVMWYVHSPASSARVFGALQNSTVQMLWSESVFRDWYWYVETVLSMQARW